MNQVYNAGCALRLYKPTLAEKVLTALQEESVQITDHSVCCRYDPLLPAGTQIINTCAGCNKRFGTLYENISTLSLWEVLAESRIFRFPDYGGISMTIHDPCPVRSAPKVHEAVRKLLQRMNIKVLEAQKNKANSVCCGDSFAGELPPEEVHAKMQERAAAMPCEEVCVYCVSCIKAMYIGGKRPRYLVDLLFNEPTDAGIHDTEQWHSLLRTYIEEHKH